MTNILPFPCNDNQHEDEQVVMGFYLTEDSELEIEFSSDLSKKSLEYLNGVIRQFQKALVVEWHKQQQ